MQDYPTDVRWDLKGLIRAKPKSEMYEVTCMDCHQVFETTKKTYRQAGGQTVEFIPRRCPTCYQAQRLEQQGLLDRSTPKPGIK